MLFYIYLDSNQLYFLKNKLLHELEEFTILKSINDNQKYNSWFLKNKCLLQYIITTFTFLSHNI